MPSRDLPRRGSSTVLASAVLALAASACAAGPDAAPGSGAPTTGVTVGSPTGTGAPTSTSTTTSTSAPTNTSTSAPASTSSAPPITGDVDVPEISAIVAAFVEERQLDGAALVVIDRDDGIVYEGYWGEFGPDRVSFVASSSKMVTAGVLLRLDDDGLLDIDAPIADVVPWGSANPEITTAQLLSNSSGLVGLLPRPFYGPYACQFAAAGEIEACAGSIFTTTGDDTDVVAPDTEFRYGGAQWQVAGAVAEAVSGRSWAELIDEIYVQPCGLRSFGYNNHFSQLRPGGFFYPEDFDGDLGLLAPTDNPNMEGGLYTTPVDYAQVMLMHLRGGMCGDTRVLSQSALDTMHADRIGRVYGGSAGGGAGYGMGWWVDRETGRISDPGAYGSIGWLDLDDGYGAFLVVEADTGTGGALAAQLDDAIDAAMTR